MSNGNLTYQDLLQIVELIKSAGHFGEFHLKMGELEIDLKRGDGSAPAAPERPPARALPAAPPAAKNQEPEPRQRHGHVGGGEVVTEPAESVADSAASAAHGAAVGPSAGQPVYPPGAVMIKSPMVGTFYRAPEPGAKPFVEIGQAVEASTTVCIIEVMKLMNSIPAGRQGVVTHILAEDGDAVEYGQLLMVIEPAH